MSNQNASIAYFGPAGSYTHQAAHERFGNEIRYIPQVTIADVFEAVEKGLTTYGIVPFENSTFGSVVTTLDKFINTETQIIEEICLTAFGQCQNWLDQHLKHVARVESSSTSHAAELSASEPGSAAISSIICSKLYGLKVLETNIQDKNDLNIGLTKIDSRPSLQRLWHYVFFVELEGNKDDYKIQKALDNLCKYCMNLKVLGSYFDNRVFL
nr:3315_t:CDS:2 [Entrophospora candida]